MNIQVLQEKKAPLLQRTDILVSITHPGAATPKQTDIQKALAQHYKVDAGLVQIERILDVYGSTTTKVTAAIYETAAAYKTFGTVAKKPKKQEEAQQAIAPAK